MKKAVITNIIRLVSVYILLFVANLFLFPALNFSLKLNMAVTFLLGFMLLFAGYSTVVNPDHRIKRFLNRLLNLTILNLLLSLSLILPHQSYLEIKKPIVNARTVTNLPNGSYLLDVEKVNINTKIIGHASTYKRQRGVYSSYDHFFAIPMVTREKDNRYSNWLVINERQQISNISKSDRVKKEFNAHRSYYRDSLKHFNPKDIHFYRVSDYATDGGKINGMYESALTTNKTNGNIRILMPQYIDIDYYKKENINTIYWSVAITLLILAIIASLKAVLNAPKRLAANHLNEPVTFKNRD